MSFTCPQQLVSAIRRGEEEARREIGYLCGTALRELVVQVRRRHGVQDDEERLTIHVARWLEMFLISYEDEELIRLATSESEQRSVQHLDDWDRTFVAFAVTAAYRRFLYGPAVILKNRKSDLLALSGVSGIPADESVAINVGELELDTKWFRRPHPNAPVSGDVADRAEVNGQLWIFVADATGHGWLAHVLIVGVARLWKALLEQSATATPRGLCEQLDKHLAACLPESFYIESWLFRFAPDRTVSATAAGRCYLIVRHDGDSAVQIEEYGNLYLGIGRLEYDEQTWDFQHGDELVIATDGLYEQPSGSALLGTHLAVQLTGVGSSLTLHDAVVEEWEAAVATEGQFDDATIVSVRSRKNRKWSSSR